MGSPGFLQVLTDKINKYPFVRTLAKSDWLLLLIATLVAWGGLFSLRGIWWDDWAWLWHYSGTSSLNDFLQPFYNLKKVGEGVLLYYSYALMMAARSTLIFGVLKFLMFIVNGIVLLSIVRRVFRNNTIALLAGLLFVISPVVNNLCLVTFVYHIELFFYFISILLMLSAIFESKFSIVKYLVSFVLGALAISMHGGLLVFDVVRLLLLFMHYRSLESSVFKAARRSIVIWLPFFIVSCCVALNMVLVPQEGVYAGAYSIKGADFILHSLKRFAFYYFSLNSSVIAKSVSMLSVTDLLVYLALGIVLFWKMTRTRFLGDLSKIKSGKLFVVGLFILVIGMLPYVLTRGGATFGLESRHALLANIGLVIILTGACLIFLQFTVRRFSSVACYRVALIVCLCYFFCQVSISKNVVNIYKDDWLQQREFWLRFVRQVPALKDNALLVFDYKRRQNDYFRSWRSSYVFGGALNLFYASSLHNSNLFQHYATEYNNDLAKLDQKRYQFIDFKGTHTVFPGNRITVDADDYKFVVSEDSEAMIDRTSTDNAYPYRWMLD